MYKKKRCLRATWPLILFMLIGLSPSLSLAASPAGYSEYFIPGPEDQLLIFHNTVNTTNFTTTHSVITTVAWSPNTVLYYDHWENGYTFDPFNPEKTGCSGPGGHCYDEKVTLATRGASHTFESAAIPAAPRNPANIYYDGRDKIYAVGGALAVNRITWPETAGTVEAIGIEVYPVRPQLTTYILPLGENLAYGTGANQDFERVFAFVQATEDGTTVQFDLNGDGNLGDTVCTSRNYPCTSTATQVTLNAGQSLLLDRYYASPTMGNPTTTGARLNVGTMIQGTQTLQVNYFFCNVGSNYNSRGISAFPTGLWDTNYYMPVGTDTGANYPTDIYVFNPQSTAITINYTSLTGSGSFSVPANSTVSYYVATGQYAAQNSATFLQGSDEFWGFYSVDRTGQDYDWSDSLIPSKLLTDEYYIGWAPGAEPPGLANADDSGIFITAAQDYVRVYVDTNNDGTAEQTYDLSRLQRQYVYDATDGDMSGSNIYATGPITMTYGENPDTAVAGNPAIDTGAAIVPGIEFEELVLSVDKATNPVIVATAAGARAVYTVTISSAKYTVDDVIVVDTLPEGWAYVAGTTQITLADKTTSTANPALSGTGSRTLTWTGLGDMAEHQQITILFTAETTRNFTTTEITRNFVEATGTRTIGNPAVTQIFTASDFVFNMYSATESQMQIEKTSGGIDPVSPGDTFAYTVKVTNSGSANLTNVSLYDPLPDGLTYVANSSRASVEQRYTVSDTFTTAAYTNNNGTQNWAGSWTETDSLGGGAASGYVLVTGGQLRFQQAPFTSNVRDEFTTNNTYGGNYGTVSWSDSWTEENDAGTPNYSTGQITLDNANNRLNFTQCTVNRAIRRTANVAGATSITVSFYFTDAGIDNGEYLDAEYSANGGSTWDPLQHMDRTNGTRTNTFAWNPADTTIILRFRAYNTWNQANDIAYIDDVNISFTGPGAASGSAIARTAANLSSTTGPVTLSFDYASAALESGDAMAVEVNGGTGFTTLATYDSTTASGTKTYDITGYRSAATAVRFSVTGGVNDTGEYISLDNVIISYGIPTTPAAVRTPPNFIITSDGYAIGPGLSLYLTYNVTVNSPLATGIESITNNACATAAGFFVAVCDDVTNIVNNPKTESATVGDRVWFDVDGDGVQDVAEPGLANVEVALKDRYGSTVAITITGGNGAYLFEGVEPGTGYYVQVTDGLPAGLVQSYPTGRTDDRTTAFNLTAGQTYLDADLGYEASAAGALIGDYVWHDADGDQVQDAGEPGLSGITVVLWRDNGDGVYQGAGTDTQVTAQTTDAAGKYLFSVASPTGNTYFATVDPGQTALSGYSATTNLVWTIAGLTGGGSSLINDFGFRNTTTTYSITDRVWFDPDEDGNDDVAAGDNNETGIAGVTVDLLNASRFVIATAETDASGYFTFTGLPGGGADYTILISDTAGKLSDFYGTTPAAVACEAQVDNLAASIDYTVEPSEPHFGYNVKGAIGDTVFNDANGNGAQDTGELGISGVTVSLYQDTNGDGFLSTGEPLAASLVTDAGGYYIFSALADGNYIVSIASPPSGYTYTSETPDNDLAAGHQQASSITSGNSDLDRDFGYQVPPAVQRMVSGTVWEDADIDGTINAGETGLASVTVTLLNSGAAVVASATTNASGYYEFTGLQSGIYTVKITDISGILTDYATTYEVTEGARAGAYNGQESVNLTAGNLANINFGYINPRTTSAVVGEFDAFNDQGKVAVRWQTMSEHGTVGFYLYRLDKRTGAYRQLNRKLLPGLLHSPAGGWYSYQDATAKVGAYYTYRLEEVEVGGTRITYGPWTVFTGAPLPAERSPVALEAHACVPGFKQASKPVSRQTLQRREARADARISARNQMQALTGTQAKISVAENGLYFISAEAIAAALDKTRDEVVALIQANTLRLRTSGRSAAVLPAADNEGLYFYGEKLATTYADTNVYWLDVKEAVTMRTVDRAPKAQADGRQYFQELVRKEESHIAEVSLFRDPREDFWMWDYVFPGYGRDQVSVSVSTPGIVDNATATLKVALQGATEVFEGNDHHAVISVNGVQVGEATWDGIAAAIISCPVDTKVLNSGENSIEVAGIQEPGVPYDIFDLNYISIEYPRQYTAIDNCLAFENNNYGTVVIHGFTDPAIKVFDLANPLRPRLLTGAAVAADENDPADYQIAFRTGFQAGRYLAVTPAAIKTCALEADQASSLSKRSNQGNYLIIAPGDLLAAARELAEYRSGRGYTAMVVDIEDIYDEFSYGIKDVQAIRTFLQLAYTQWRMPPKYVVLAGEGSFDYKNAMGNDDCLVPSLLTGTTDGLFTTDTLYADVTGDDGIPEFSVGRIPAANSEELSDYTAKVIAYEAAGGAWASHALLSADASDAGGNFSASSDEVAGLFPHNFVLDRIYLDAMPLAEARAAFRTNITEGRAFVNFIGHGGLTLIGNATLFSSDTLAQLENGDRLPVVTAMTCMAGNFGYPGLDSLGEAMVLKKNGGAVAMWSPTGFAFNYDSIKLCKGFYAAVFESGKKTLGDAILSAQKSYADSGKNLFYLSLYNLIGDPALAIK